MAEPEVVIEAGENGADVEMEEEVVETVGADNGDEEDQPTGLDDIEPEVPTRTTFLDNLRSPIIELVVGQGEEQTSLFAHQGLLVQSPFFQEAISQFSDPNARHRIELLTEDLEATASVVEFMYKADYFPALSTSQTLENDPSTPYPDNEGVALLSHARVYTLAQKFGMPALAGLAHKKIHLTESTARGEIAYARYVYGNTAPSDENIRKPVAAFWATRSHVLRHNAEDEFRRMCLEYPQFGFDVLSLVLDQQEKRTQRQEASSTGTGTGRKRARMSQG